MKTNFTKKQVRFLNEIKKYNYSKDEAYAEIINSKSKFNSYKELEIVVNWYFNNID